MFLPRQFPLEMTEDLNPLFLLLPTYIKATMILLNFSNLVDQPLMKPKPNQPEPNPTQPKPNQPKPNLQKTNQQKLKIAILRQSQMNNTCLFPPIPIPIQYSTLNQEYQYNPNINTIPIPIQCHIISLFRFYFSWLHDSFLTRLFV
jgi:hypothetical protein